ncbi:hypothetical protein LJR296_006853 [Cupriavidus necator]|uniref:hypothetical protein n=1 Tax=Cupriavidus necator TaxID=106590 RepID=UPI003ED15F96
MGAKLAVTTSNPGTAWLHNFADTIVAKIELVGGGKWVIMGRMILGNGDGDYQGATAKLVHDANVVLDHAEIQLKGGIRTCMYLQSCLIVKEREVITLECNTYKGEASCASLIAFNVDDIQVQ